MLLREGQDQNDEIVILMLLIYENVNFVWFKVVTVNDKTVSN